MIKKIILAFLTIVCFTELEAQITFENTYNVFDYNDRGYAVHQTYDSGYVVIGTEELGLYSNNLIYLRANKFGTLLGVTHYSMQSLSGYAAIESIDSCTAGVGRNFLNQYDLWFFKIRNNGTMDIMNSFGGLYDDEGRCIQRTNDNGYIITGFTEINDSYNYRLYLIRLTENGDLVWKKSFDELGYSVGNSVVQSSDGGFVVCGIVENENTSSSDVLLIKTNENGVIVWSKTIGGPDEDAGNSIQQTTDNGFIIAGNTTSFGNGNEDVFLIKTNSEGDTLWTNTIGGSESDRANSVCLAADGGYVIAGSTRSYGAGDSDVYLIKTDQQGDTMWTQTFGGSYTDYGRNIRKTKDNGFIIVGNSGGFNGGAGVYLIKTDDNGIVSWVIESTMSSNSIKQFPNPFSDLTSIEFELLQASHVAISIFDINGNLMDVVINNHKQKGLHRIEYDGTSLAKGIYFLSLKVGSDSYFKKMIKY